MNPTIAIVFVFIGCCSNVVFLELLVRDHPGSGNIITFAQFLFIALEGFIFTINFGSKRPAIPLRRYAIMVAIFFVVQVTNNYALNFNISMPLHMIFRAGSLIANLVLGIIILERRYSLTKYLSVFMITVGIAICTVASAKQVKSAEGNAAESNFHEFLWWAVGVTMLTFALFMSALMGIYQEMTYKEFGKHPKEALFYNHSLPLPGFLLMAADIGHSATVFNQSALLEIPLLAVSVPRLWLFLALNVLTQYICIRSVFILTTECPSLTVTLVVTLRKFVSLLFSIVYFSNPFTTYHWLGTTLVFSGTLLFVDVYGMIRKSIRKKRD